MISRFKKINCVKYNTDPIKIVAEKRNMAIIMK
jgi:hypothetical protein